MPQFDPRAIFEALRMQNIFGNTPVGNDLPSQGGITGNLPKPPTDMMFRPGMEQMPSIRNPQIGDPSQAMPLQVRSAMQQQPQADINPMEMYKPETRAQDALYGMLQNFPKRNEPNLLRKIAAIAASFNGSEAVERTLYAPYIREMQEFGPRFQATQEAANQERLSNNTLRQIATSAAQNRVAQQRADIAQQQADTATKNAESNRIRATAYSYAQNHPNHRIEMDNQGRLIGIDPKTNKMEYIIEPSTGQPVKGSDLPFELAQNILKQSRLAIVEAQTAGDIAVERERQTGREALAEDKEKWTPFNIPDPNDPTKTIGVMVSESGEVKPLSLGGKPVAGGLQRPGVPSRATIQQPQNAAAIKVMAQRALDALDRVVDKNNKLKPEIKPGLGIGSYIGMVPGPTAARAAYTKVDQLKNILTLDLITELKTASRTGATGMGNMSNRDLGVLERAASRIDPSMKVEDFEAAVAEEAPGIREKLELMLQEPTGGNIEGNVAPPGTPPIRTIRIRNAQGQTATMPENRQVPSGWTKVGYVE